MRLGFRAGAEDTARISLWTGHEEIRLSNTVRGLGWHRCLPGRCRCRRGHQRLGLVCERDGHRSLGGRDILHSFVPVPVSVSVGRRGGCRMAETLMADPDLTRCRLVMELPLVHIVELTYRARNGTAAGVDL